MTSRTMRAQVLHEWGGEVRYETVAMPSAAPGEALIEVEACSVGLTVLNYMSGNHSRRPEDLPRIPGHEVVGRVIATGEAVAAPRVGNRVMTHFYLFCGACDLCNLGHEPLSGISRARSESPVMAVTPSTWPCPRATSFPCPTACRR